jgi:undecaprenyl-diphosphatase
MTDFLNKLDRSLFLWLNGLHLSFLDQLMVFLSGQFVWIPMLLFFVWKGKRTLEKKRFYLFLLFTVLGLILTDVTSSYLLKNIFTRMRPCRLDELRPFIHQFGQKCGGKYGFVSSHAANSTLLVFFSLRALNLRGKFQVLWLLPLIVGFSRIYLGVHYPGDVAGGALVGVFWSVIMLRMFERT